MSASTTSATEPVEKLVETSAVHNVETVAALNHSFTAELTVESYLSGVRIDRFLVRHFRNYTLYRIQRMIRAGQARVNGLTAAVEQRVFRGQRVSIRLIEGPDKLFEPEPLPVEVLYEDPWLLVVNKPAGQVTHPVSEFQTGTLTNALQSYFDRQTSKPGLLRPGIVHRLDRMTSGVLLVCKEHLSHRGLSIQFQHGEVQKSYLAIVEGPVELSCGTIDLPIGQQPSGSSILMSAGRHARNPRPAQTWFRVFARFENRTLVEAQPLTGRNHQIRVHLAAIGHPIVGDEFYGAFGEIRGTLKEEIRPRASAGSRTSFKAEIMPGCEGLQRGEVVDFGTSPPSRPPGQPSAGARRCPSAPATRVDSDIASSSLSVSSSLSRLESGRQHCQSRQGAARHLLHAHRMLFVHPIHGDRRCVEAPLPEDMQAVVGRLVNQYHPQMPPATEHWQVAAAARE